MNKVGGEKILSIWWFFVLALVSAGVVGGVFLFYSFDLDVREVESGIMVNRVYDCIGSNGFLREDVFLDGFDIYEYCDINKELFYKNGSEVYLEVEVFDLGELVFSNYSRNNDLKKSYDISSEVEFKDPPKGFLGSEVFLYREDGEIKNMDVKVVFVSDQKGESLHFT